MIFFRVDSNEEIAGGHLMRCISLAKAFKSCGQDVLFLVADNNPVLILESYQLAYIVLGTDWRDLNSDADLVIDIMSGYNESVLIIDSYSINKAYVQKLKPFAKIAYLGSLQEDLGELDYLINYSIEIDDAFYNDIFKETKLMLGPSYAPLRSEFVKSKVSYPQEIRRILLTTGNTNQNGALETILEALLPVLDNYDFEIHVIVGKMVENRDEIYSRFAVQKEIVFHENVHNMAKIMSETDLAISANGTTVYELASMCVPVISFAMVNEQKKNAISMEKAGLISYCGLASSDDTTYANEIVKKLIEFADDVSKAVELAKKAHSIIDGHGCEKICNVILNQ